MGNKEKKASPALAGPSNHFRLSDTVVEDGDSIHLSYSSQESILGKVIFQEPYHNAYPDIEYSVLYS